MFGFSSSRRSVQDINLKAHSKVIRIRFRYIKYGGRVSWPGTVYPNLISFNHGWCLQARRSGAADIIFFVVIIPIRFCTDCLGTGI